MSNPIKILLASTAALTVISTAHAADMRFPEVIEAPAAPVFHQPDPIHVKDKSGWYLRGDVGYRWSETGDINYSTYNLVGGLVEITPATFSSSDLDGSFSVGGGVGYQINNYLRTDVTLDWWAETDFTGSTTGTCAGVPCVSSDVSTMQAIVLLANAYVDLGTYHGITPYVGAGIGGARVEWGHLDNTAGGVTTRHGGASDWRFAYALMAGASYCVNDRLDVDLGYRYTHIENGRMFEYVTGTAGPGYDDGINSHEVRAGLRYKLGKGRPCHGEKVVYHQPPEPMPPIYK